VIVQDWTLTENGQTYHRIHCKYIRKWALNEINNRKNICTT